MQSCSCYCTCQIGCSSCGGSCLAMSTVKPNASIKQNVCKSGCGGASCLSTALNNIGKWGTVLTATIQGKPVVANGVAVGARGSTTVGGMSSTTLLLVLAVIAVLIFVALRR